MQTKQRSNHWPALAMLCLLAVAGCVSVGPEETREVKTSPARVPLPQSGQRSASVAARLPPGMPPAQGRGAPAPATRPAHTNVVAGAEARRPPGPTAIAKTPQPPASPPPVRAAPAPATSFKTVLAVQVFLDRQNLSCGCIDGVYGSRTRIALKAWQQNQGLKASGEINEAVLQAVGNMNDSLTTHEVTPEEVAALTAVPDSWAQKSRLPRLGYQTVLETVAEKFHASEGAIRRLNPDAAWPDPPAGARLVVPNPLPSPEVKAARLAIQIRKKTVLAYDAAGRVVGVFPCSIAAKVEKRPTGELKVVNCAPNPDYTYDPAIFAEDQESKHIPNKLLIPPGPNNPVGVAWIGLSLPGYGMHGTPKPEDIGKTESHGCFRLANWNAERLLHMIRIGMPVAMDWEE